MIIILHIIPLIIFSLFVSKISTILHGRMSKPNEFAHTVCITLDTTLFEGNREEVCLCGGSLINSNTILTTAHCLSKFKLFDIFDGIKEVPLLGRPDLTNYDNIIVIIGKTNVDHVSSEYLYRIKDVKIHPNFDYDVDLGSNMHFECKNDIAMIFIDGEVMENGENIKYADLPEQNEEITEGEVLYFSSFGFNHTSKKKSSSISNLNLMKSQFIVSNNKSLCHAKYYFKEILFKTIYYTAFINDNEFCAFNRYGNRQYLCKGDSGYSLVKKEKRNLRWRIVGIGKMLDRAGNICSERFQVFQKVSPYIHWIWTHTEKPPELIRKVNWFKVFLITVLILIIIIITLFCCFILYCCIKFYRRRKRERNQNGVENRNGRDYNREKRTKSKSKFKPKKYGNVWHMKRDTKKDTKGKNNNKKYLWKYNRNKYTSKKRGPKNETYSKKKQYGKKRISQDRKDHSAPVKVMKKYTKVPNWMEEEQDLKKYFDDRVDNMVDE